MSLIAFHITNCVVVDCRIWGPQKRALKCEPVFSCILQLHFGRLAIGTIRLIHSILVSGRHSEGKMEIHFHCIYLAFAFIFEFTAFWSIAVAKFFCAALRPLAHHGWVVVVALFGLSNLVELPVCFKSSRLNRIHPTLNGCCVQRCIWIQTHKDFNLIVMSV